MPGSPPPAAQSNGCRELHLDSRLHRDVEKTCYRFAAAGGRGAEAPPVNQLRRATLMGIELELAVLLAIAVIGPSTQVPFEVETPPWRRILKWAIVVAPTVGIYRVAGHWPD